VEDIETPCLTDVMECSAILQPRMSAMEQMQRRRRLTVKRKISGKARFDSCLNDSVKITYCVLRNFYLVLTVSETLGMQVVGEQN
jgi:hypothetical protein